MQEFSVLTNFGLVAQTCSSNRIHFYSSRLIPMIETNAWRKFLANLNRDCIQAISPQWICPKFPGDERLWLQSMICDVIYNDAAHWLNVRGIHGFPHEGHPISHFDSWNLRQNRLLDLLGWCNDEAVQLEVCGLMAVSV